SPGAWPVTSLVSSPSVRATSAPSSGPKTVPMPPMIGASSASIEMQVADAADERLEQRCDGDRGAVGDAGVEEEEVLRVEAAARRRERGRDDHGNELDAHRVDPSGLDLK